MRTCVDPPLPIEVPNVRGEKYTFDNATKSGNRSIFGDSVYYDCEIARKLRNPHLNKVESKQELKCQWNHTWTPTQPFECEWIQCIDPPNGTEYNLTVDYELGIPTEFNDSVTYSCKKDHFFVSDRNKENFQVKCLTDGTYDVPKEWPRCVDSTLFYKAKICKLTFVSEICETKRGRKWVHPA